MEAHPLTAVLVEKVTDCDQTAWALGCDKCDGSEAREQVLAISAFIAG